MSVGVGNASPHHSSRFRDGKSLNRTTSNCAMYLRADGTENHCVSSLRRMNSATLWGSRLTSCDRRCSCAPARNVPQISNVDKSKCSGGWHEMRSDAAMPKYRIAHFKKCITLEWVITTPFGVPVDPDVNRMCAPSSELLSHATGRGDSAERSSQEKAQEASEGLPGSSQPTRTDFRIASSGSDAFNSFSVEPTARI